MRNAAHEHLTASLANFQPSIPCRMRLLYHGIYTANYRETFRPQFALIFPPPSPPHIEAREPSFSFGSHPPPSTRSSLFSMKRAFNFKPYQRVNAPPTRLLYCIIFLCIGFSQAMRRMVININ